MNRRYFSSFFRRLFCGKMEVCKSFLFNNIYILFLYFPFLRTLARAPRLGLVPRVCARPPCGKCGKIPQSPQATSRQAVSAAIFAAALDLGKAQTEEAVLDWVDARYGIVHGMNLSWADTVSALLWIDKEAEIARARVLRDQS